MTSTLATLKTTPSARPETSVAPATESGLRYLTEQEFPLWDALVLASPQGSVFCRSWWLRAVGAVRVLGYFEKGGLIAGIPLYFEKRLGFTLCTMPKRCPFWGVIIHPLHGKKVNVASRETDILRIFAKHLAAQRLFFQLFHPTIQNWLPFYWNGFKQASRVTYVLDDLQDLRQTWDQLAHNVRGEIRKANTRGLTVVPCSIDTVLEAERKTFARQGITQPSADCLRRLYFAAVQNNAAECFAAGDRQGRIHAANLLIWDSKSAYFFAGGADPDLRSSGATSLLVWHLIELAAERSQAFDFNGSVLQPIERFFRAYGGKQISCHAIMKFSLGSRMLLMLAGKM
jgi:Acetyltransferase (GNAT) domain